MSPDIKYTEDAYRITNELKRRIRKAIQSLPESTLGYDVEVEAVKGDILGFKISEIGGSSIRFCEHYSFVASGICFEEFIADRVKRLALGNE